MPSIDAAEDRVLAVEMRRRHEGQKELRAARVAAGVRHAQAAAEVVPVVRLVTFAADRVAGAAVPSPFGSPPWAMNCGNTR